MHERGKARDATRTRGTGGARSTTDGAPTTARRPRSKERFNQRRQEVVDIAARVFAERGYHATSIEDLVEATGLQRGGLYHYIDGKKDLLIQIHERFIEPLLAEAEDIVARGESPDETLRSLARALVHDIATYNNQVTVFLHEWRVIESDPEWKTIRSSRKRFEQLIEQVLEAGEEQGLFVIPDRRNAMLAFLGMINYSYQWYRPGGRTSPQVLADQFCGIFLNGIRSH